MLRRLLLCAGTGWLLLYAGVARADDASDMSGYQSSLFDSGRLLATGGVSQLDGAGGGGLAPWALITGYGTADSLGGDAHYTYINLPAFTAHSFGAAIGAYNRVEFSYAHTNFDTNQFGAHLGLGDGFTLHQDVLGAKLRIYGDAVYEQDSLMPQIAAGVFYKSVDHADVLRAIGARGGSSGVDFYVAATKLLLAQSLLLNTTVRLTRANQEGLLGFGGNRNDAYQPEFEGSAAFLLDRHMAIGGEYRTMPDNLTFARSSAWYDAFLAVFLNKHASATLAFVDLGGIATSKPQRGIYLSLQIGL